MSSDQEPYKEKRQNRVESRGSRGGHSFDTHHRSPSTHRSLSSSTHPSRSSSVPVSPYESDEKSAHYSGGASAKRSSSRPSTVSNHTSLNNGGRRHRSRSSSIRNGLLKDDKSNFGDVESDNDSDAAPSITSSRCHSRSSSRYHGSTKSGLSDKPIFDEYVSDDESIKPSSLHSSANSHDRLMVEVLDRYGAIQRVSGHEQGNRGRRRYRDGSICSNKYGPTSTPASSSPTCSTFADGSVLLGPRSSLRRSDDDSVYSQPGMSSSGSSSYATTTYTCNPRDASVASLVRGEDDNGSSVETYLPLTNNEISNMTIPQLEARSNRLISESQKDSTAISDTDYGSTHLVLLGSWLKMIHELKKKLLEEVWNFERYKPLAKFFKKASLLRSALQRDQEEDHKYPINGDQFMKLQLYRSGESRLIEARDAARISAADLLNKPGLGFNDFQEEYAFQKFVKSRNVLYKYYDGVKMSKEAKKRRKEEERRKEALKRKEREEFVESQLSLKDAKRFGHGHGRVHGHKHRGGKQL